MTSPREQAIEAAAKVMCEAGGFNPDEIMANDGPRWRHYVPGATAAIDAYESARARLDGAKMMPREATALPLEVVLSEENDALIAENKRLKRELDDAQARLATEIDRAMETARQADRMREERLRKRYGE